MEKQVFIKESKKALGLTSKNLSEKDKRAIFLLSALLEKAYILGKEEGMKLPPRVSMN
jgi:hypothetical protein